MAKKDTIPRLHRVVEHTRDQLIGIAEGKPTFEDARLRYGETQRRLERQGRGRVTASRVPEHEKNWSPAREALAELMKIGALASARLPSARQFVDGYRNATFELTPEGEDLAALARSNSGEFTDSLAARLISAHPYLRRLLVTLEDGPIVRPFVTEGDVQRGRDEHFGFDGWGEWGAARIAVDVEPARVSHTVAEHVKRRFGSARQEKPSNKAMSEVLTDAMAVSGFAARGLTLDANTIKTLMRWGSDLLLFDQSRYVPEHPDANIVWLACEITTAPDGHPRTARRGFAKHGVDVGNALIRAYEQQATALETMLDRPYLPVHQVRAQAAFETNTMRALGDLVLTRMIDGEMPEVDATVIPYIGTSSLPQSEPAFRHHGRRRLEIQIAPGTSRSTTPKKEHLS